MTYRTAAEWFTLAYSRPSDDGTLTMTAVEHLEYLAYCEDVNNRVPDIGGTRGKILLGRRIVVRISTPHVVHDLGCTEPCTCGAWDRAVEREADDASQGEAALHGRLPTASPHGTPSS